MKSRYSMFKILSVLLPTGALGVSMTLASLSAKAGPALEQAGPGATKSENVAERLQNIRRGVSDVTEVRIVDAGSDPDIVKAWWGNGGWGRGGWGRGGWGNGGGWRNGGWGNGGWHNGGWGNGWHNGWRNW